MGIQALFSRRHNPGRRTLDRAGSFSTLIGAETRFTGRIEGKDNYIVNGTVEGDCDIDGVILLSEQGRWIGNIQAVNIVIAGEVQGDITAGEKLELTPTARVSGRISSPVIAIAEGAIHQGEIRMAREGAVQRFSGQREQDSLS